jgi:peptidoglycan/LPS O-acetylase OafA/YrhL
MHRNDRSTASFIDLHLDGRGRLGHLRGLDGMRGLAVAGVVLFHLDLGGMVGGYLGVSTFFTLSGFLITSVLLAGEASVGRVRLRGFYGRRVRRLFPASALTLFAVAALFGPLVASAAQLERLPGDVVASLAQVANWRFIAEGTSYGQLFAEPSPVLHFWSLAIEEQFYLLYPLVLWLLVRLARGRRAVVGSALLVLSLASAALMVWGSTVGGFSVDRAYFGTDTRAAELLVGGVLAVALLRRDVRVRLALRPSWRRAALVVGAAALAVQLWWWWSVPQDSEWLYRGGLTVYAALSCAVILAAAMPAGPVHRLLSGGLLGWLGSRSYAIYLFHWPVLLTVRQTISPGTWVTALLVLGVTLPLAELSYRLLERPIRLRRWPARRVAPLSIMSAAALVVVVSLVAIPAPGPGAAPDFEGDLAAYEEFLDEQAGTTTSSPGPATTVPTTVAGATPDLPATSSTTVAPAPAPPPVPRVGVFGDSTGLLAGVGLGLWSVDTGRLGVARGDTKLGCPLPRFPRLRVAGVVSPGADCLSWPTAWAELVGADRPDIALLISAVWSRADAQVPGSGDFSAVGDPVVDAFVESEYLQAIDTLASAGAFVLVATWPRTGDWYDDGRPASIKRQADPARADRVNDLIRSAVAQRPGVAGVLDVAAYLGDRYTDRELRKDGEHIEAPEFVELSEEWVGGEIERQWAAIWRLRVELRAAAVQRSSGARPN